ncbi:hypothetical protein AMTR_s00017p00065420 [Amborella trichopoda]|uniref:Uncharacterized protein n=1 Tax=Amborella trichopoda TaxID=13333 RepID=W1PMZ4_AMBTC|nr:hypothetical protein AMTR_s00017p00065420 [Amborella trichopoda]
MAMGKAHRAAPTFARPMVMASDLGGTYSQDQQGGCDRFAKGKTGLCAAHMVQNIIYSSKTDTKAATFRQLYLPGKSHPYIALRRCLLGNFSEASSLQTHRA